MRVSADVPGVSAGQQVQDRTSLTRGKYEAELGEDPDEYGPLPVHGARDPIDTRRLLGVLQGLFEAGNMPELGQAILEAESAGCTHPEIAAELGLTEDTVRMRLKSMRKLFKLRVAELGMLVMMVGLLAVAGAPDFLGMHRGPVPRELDPVGDDAKEVREQWARAHEGMVRQVREMEAKP